MFKWDPEPGILFIREICDEHSVVESHLGYALQPRNHPQAGLRYITLLEHNFGITKPSSFTWTEYTYSKEEALSETRRVVRRLASNQDINFLLDKWDVKERISPEDWIDRVWKNHRAEDAVLLQSEFNRLNILAQSYAEHPLNRR
jgi:hypothetical protein